MANINNTVSYGGLLNAPKNSYGSLFQSPTGITPTATPNVFSASPTGTQTSPNVGAQGLTGLLSPNHSSLASSLSAGPVKSIKTGSDGTVTTTHDTATPATSASTATQPITGNTQTPSGATVNADTGSLVTPPAQQTGLAGSIGTLNNLATQSPASQQGLAQSGQAFTGTQDYIKQLEQSRQNEAAVLQEQAGQPIPLGDITGRQQALANYYAQQQAALGSAGQAESNLYSPGLNAAVTGQGQQITAAGTAGQLSTPGNQFITQPFNTQLVGADGQPIGGASGSGALQNAVVNAINLIKNGSGYSNAVSAANLGQFGPQGTTALLQALGPNFNVNMADADAAAVAQNINTTTTASTNASNTAYNSAVQKVAANTATYSALTGVSNNLNETLANWTQGGQLTALNQALNRVAGLTSNPQYQQFITALGNAQASYQAALGASGVTPTKADQDAVAALSPNSSATAINAALNQLSADAHALLIVPAYQQQQTYASQLGIQ